MDSKRELTVLLNRINCGDAAAESEAFEKVYNDLRKTAHRLMRTEGSAHTLQPTALVNEAYLRLVEQSGTDYQNRQHFFAIAARVMRRVLVDGARARLAEKRGGASRAIEWDDNMESPASHSNQEIVELDQALSQLAMADARAAQVIEMRVFGGYELQEVADTLKTSLATVKRDLVFAKAWLSAQGYV